MYGLFCVGVWRCYWQTWKYVFTHMDTYLHKFVLYVFPNYYYYYCRFPCWSVALSLNSWGHKFEPGPRCLLHKWIFFSEISVDHCLNYRGHALNDALGREHAALLRDTRCIWGNQEYNKVDPLTLNRLFINHHYFFILLVLSNFLFHSICHFLPSPHFPTATILLLF